MFECWECESFLIGIWGTPTLRGVFLLDISGNFNDIFIIILYVPWGLCKLLNWLRFQGVRGISGAILGGTYVCEWNIIIKIVRYLTESAQIYANQ